MVIAILALGGNSACRLLPVDLDIFFGPAVGDRDHDPQADQDRDANHYPGCVDVLQDAQFPESSENATDQDDEPNKVHPCPFHDAPPDKARFLELQNMRRRARSLCAGVLVARAFDRQAFAEGVESEEQAKSLRLLKRDEMHGYFFGKPPSVELPAKMI
ncbi:MAG TPA: hypothetical protein VGJ74_14840 [Burkholderiales bacterium]